MSTKQSKRKQPNLQATIEISQSELSVVVVDKSSEPHTIRGRHSAWLNEASSLEQEDAVQDLAAALGAIVVAEKLAGSNVNIALSSDFCVTRVVAGETEKVRSELQSLKTRSNDYLLLGAGEKAVAESTRAIDAKQTQAWLTVTNSQTLNHITGACSQAGLQVGLIEHDMVAICRAVGHMQRDAEKPVIVAKISKQGLVLGVSFKGQLLFDYRPGGVDCKGRAAEIVHRHLERIQRYCDRQFRFAAGEIRSVLICGSADNVEPVRRQFAESPSHLEAVVLSPQEVCPEWRFDDSLEPDASFFAAVGGALVEEERLGASASGRGMPNLMDYVLSANRAPLWPSLIKTAWPMAAVILLSIGVYGLSAWKGSSASELEQRVAEFDSELNQIQSMKRKTTVANTKLGYLHRIKDSVRNPAWNELILWVGQSMPDGVWLDTMRVDHDGMVSITGPGASEDLIYEFVGHLKRIPVLDQVNLEGQQPIKLKQGPAIKFDIKCRFNDQKDLIERTASNG